MPLPPCCHASLLPSLLPVGRRRGEEPPQDTWPHIKHACLVSPACYGCVSLFKQKDGGRWWWVVTWAWWQFGGTPLSLLSLPLAFLSQHAGNAPATLAFWAGPQKWKKKKKNLSRILSLACACACAMPVRQGRGTLGGHCILSNSSLGMVVAALNQVWDSKHGRKEGTCMAWPKGRKGIYHSPCFLLLIIFSLSDLPWAPLCVGSGRN